MEIHEGLEKERDPPRARTLVIKVSVVGDQGVGKTSYLRKACEGNIDEDSRYGCFEKTVFIRDVSVNFSMWDIGAAREFGFRLPLVCDASIAILFMFDLTRKLTLNSIREWYREVRPINRTAVPILVGTKFDLFVSLTVEEQEEITRAARKYARAMKAPLIFCSSTYSINIKNILKIILCKVFELRCNLPTLSNIGEPIIDLSYCNMVV